MNEANDVFKEMFIQLNTLAHISSILGFLPPFASRLKLS